ncbi:LPXTG cell wall anchor domain-containing protein, partial [Thomasclavelia sp.]
LNNPNATEEEVEKAVKGLTKAMAGLEVNPANPPVENTANNPGNTVKAGDTTKATKTGDNTLVGVFAGLAMLSIAGLSILRKKED